MNRFKENLCFESKGWPWTALIAYAASSAFLNSTKTKLSSKKEWDHSVETRGFYIAHPLLLPVFSSHGINISSGFTGAPFLPNSLDILASSFSAFEGSITGTPSRTTTLSRPSSSSTWYLEMDYVKTGPEIAQKASLTLLQCQNNQYHLQVHSVLCRWGPFLWVSSSLYSVSKNFRRHWLLPETGSTILRKAKVLNSASLVVQTCTLVDVLSTLNCAQIRSIRILKTITFIHYL